MSGLRRLRWDDVMIIKIAHRRDPYKRWVKTMIVIVDKPRTSKFTKGFEDVIAPKLDSSLTVRIKRSTMPFWSVHWTQAKICFKLSDLASLMNEPWNSEPLSVWTAVTGNWQALIKFWRNEAADLESLLCATSTNAHLEKVSTAQKRKRSPGR